MSDPTCGECKWYPTNACPRLIGGGINPEDPACAPGAASMTRQRHLTACQATVDMVHRLLGTESVTEIQGRIAELEAERTRKDKGE